eukprot:4303624-Prymnesium_polylepis.1
MPGSSRSHDRGAGVLGCGAGAHRVGAAWKEGQRGGASIAPHSRYVPAIVRRLFVFWPARAPRRLRGEGRGRGWGELEFP